MAAVDAAKLPRDAEFRAAVRDHVEFGSEIAMQGPTTTKTRSFRSTRITEHVAPNFPGFISASVHRSNDGTRVFNYLQWETAEHLAAMQRSPEFQASAEWIAG
jgi:hypothetical protein